MAVACNNNDTAPQAEPQSKELRIISLVPSISAEITQLGMKENIVGATSYCAVSKENPELIVGSVIDINEEKIMLLKPDIVFASGLVKAESIKILRDNGIKVAVFASLHTFDDLCNNFIEIGAQIKKKQQAIDYVTKAKHKIDSIYNTIGEAEVRPRIFFEIGANPLATVVENTFIHNFAVLCKADNVFANLTSIIISRESAVLKNPSHIIISSMGVVGEQEKELWKKYADMEAVKNNNIFVVEGLTTPTVSAFVANYEFIKNNIYKN